MFSLHPSAKGIPIAGGMSMAPVPATDGSVPAEDSVLVTVQLRLGHHQTGVVLCAPMFDT